MSGGAETRLFWLLAQTVQNLNLKPSVSSVEFWRGVSSSPAPSSAAYDSCGGGASAGGGGGGGCDGVSVRGGSRANLGSVAMLSRG